MSGYITDGNESLKPLQDLDVNTDTTGNSCLDVFEESNSEASVDTCCNDDLSESFNPRVAKSESYNSVCRLASNSSTIFSSDNTLFGSESLMDFLPHLSFYIVPTLTMLYRDISADETPLQKCISVKIKEGTARGFDDGNDGDDDSSEDETGDHGNLLTHHHTFNPQHLPNSPRHKSLLATVNTSLMPQTSISAGTIV